MSQAKRETEDKLPTGTVLGNRFVIGRRLGRGGMGSVYEAHDRKLDAPVALKILDPRHDHDRNPIRFRREFQTLSRLRHPRVVAAHEYFIEDGRTFYSMELLDGADLRELEAPDPKALCSMLRDVASALAMLHAQRLIHRDISRRNVRCTSAGHAKLLDFGLVSTFGASAEMAGTLPYIAPELLRGLPPDERADLFSLGVVAYRVLTGRYPYPGRNTEERARSQKTLPPKPSSKAPNITPELDALLLSLLALDRAARPRTAAEVIERLNAVGRLTPVPELETAHGYVHSAGLVGRDLEMGELKRGLERARKGQGESMLIRGRSGAGKSRLLREVAMEARFGGAVVVEVTATRDAREPFSTLRRIAAELLRAMPQEAREASARHGAHLVRVLPELVRVVGDVAGAPPIEDPREDRLAIQSALTGWLTELSDQRPLVLLVDDLQRTDEASAAVLASMASKTQSRPLFMVSSLRTDEPMVAEAPLRALENASARLSLRGLEERDLHTLVKQTFGDIPNAAPLTRMLREAAGGSPLLTSELLHWLVDQGHIRYADGSWLVSADITEAQVPPSLKDAMDARVVHLPEAARRLAEIIAVHGGQMSLELCVSLMPEEEEDRVFGMLDDLVREEIVIGTSHTYHIRHDGLREALLRGLSDEQLRAIHLHVGTVLLEEGRAVEERQGEVGWHLLKGGLEREGAQLLEAAGHRLFEATSFAEAIPALSAAAEVYERTGERTFQLPGIHFRLSMAGFFVDRHVASAHADRAIESLGHAARVGRIGVLQRVFGARLGMAVAMITRLLGHALSPRETRGPNPFDALRMYIRSVAFAASLALASAERDRLVRLRDLLIPFAKLSSTGGRGIYELLNMFVDVSFGRFGKAHAAATELLGEGLVKPRTVGDFEFRLFHGAVLFFQGLVAGRSGSQEALQIAEQLEKLRVRLWSLGALQVRMQVHLRRGEEAVVRRLRRRLELAYVQLGTVWQLELGLASTTAMSYGLIGDILGLKRSIDTFQQLVDEGVPQRATLELARADYFLLRGEPERAVDSVHRAREALPPGEGFPQAWAHAVLVEALVDLSRLDEAREAAEAALAFTSDPAYRDDGYYYRVGRAYARLLTARGDRDGAIATLERLLREAAPKGNPAYLGLLHEARAAAALRMSDRVSFEVHRDHASAHFKETQNPVLIGRIEQLEVREAVADVLTEEDAPEATVTILEAKPVEHLLDQHADSEVRAGRALGLLLRACGARDGYLHYITASGELRLVAPANRASAPRELEAAMTRTLRTGLDWQEVTVSEARYRILVLSADADPEAPRAAVAVASIRIDEGPLAAPDKELLLRLTGELVSAGDVRPERSATDTVNLDPNARRRGSLP